jgi:hypothetical protein
MMRIGGLGRLSVLVRLPYLGRHGIARDRDIGRRAFRLPGLGPRSARRAVLWLIKRRETALPALIDALDALSQR